jgi:hypothetical protein
MDKYDYLMMAGAESINYESLSDAELAALAKCDDMFIVNSAITELGIRESQYTAKLAEEILTESRFDRYAKATALNVLFDANQSRAVEYMTKEIYSVDSYIFDTMLDILVTSRSDIGGDIRRRLVNLATQRLASSTEGDEYPSIETVEVFRKTFT